MAYNTARNCTPSPVSLARTPSTPMRASSRARLRPVDLLESGLGASGSVLGAETSDGVQSAFGCEVS